MLLTDDILRNPYMAAGLWGRITLDDLAAKQASLQANKIALVESAGANSSGEPRRLDWQAVNCAINAIAGRLISLGLKPDDLVAWQGGTSIEAPLVMLGIMRAGMIAVPLPAIWSVGESANALKQVSPKAILAGSPEGHRNFAASARDIAAEVFSIRHVFGFGTDLPDGISGLDDIFELQKIPAPSDDREDKAEHIATMCWWNNGEPLPQVMARSHNHWIAAALGPVMEAHFSDSDVILTANGLTGLAGFSTILVPWLLSGAKLVLHPPFDQKAFLQTAFDEQANVAVLPGPVSVLLETKEPSLPFERIINLWPDLYAASNAEFADELEQTPENIDVFVLGEAAVVARKRTENIAAGYIPLGKIPLPGNEKQPPRLLEIRVKGRAIKADSDEPLIGGEIQVAGPMVPASQIGAAQQRARTLEDKTYRYLEGFIGTGIQCRITPENTAIIAPVAPLSQVIILGGAVISNAALEADYKAIDGILDAAVYPIEDPLFGQKIGVYLVIDSDVIANQQAALDMIAGSGIGAHKLPEHIDFVEEIQRNENDAYDPAGSKNSPERLTG